MAFHLRRIHLLRDCLAGHSQLVSNRVSVLYLLTNLLRLMQIRDCSKLHAILGITADLEIEGNKSSEHSDRKIDTKSSIGKQSDGNLSGSHHVVLLLSYIGKKLTERCPIYCSRTTVQRTLSRFISTLLNFIISPHSLHL